MTSLLSERAMLARLTIKQWSARRIDKRITNEVNSAHNARADAGRYNKRLIAKAALESIAKIAWAARLEHYKLTSPWQDDGSRILSAKLYQQYASAMREYRIEFEEAAARFVDSYPSLIEQAKSELNGLFSEEDYPPAEQIAKRFEFAVQIFNVPDAADFRVTLAYGQAADIRSEIEATMQSAMQTAMRDAWQRVADVVGHMRDKLRAYRPATETTKVEGIFRDSLVENVKELVGILPALNLASDPALDEICMKLHRDCCFFSADDLRDSPAFRDTVSSAADSILETVGAYLS